MNHLDHSFNMGVDRYHDSFGYMGGKGRKNRRLKRVNTLGIPDDEENDLPPSNKSEPDEEDEVKTRRDAIGRSLRDYTTGRPAPDIFKPSDELLRVRLADGSETLRARDDPRGFMFVKNKLNGAVNKISLKRPRKKK